MPGSMLAPLRALTALALADTTTVSSWVGSASPWLRAATLEHLSSLDRLRELELRGSNGHTKFPVGVALTALQHLSGTEHCRHHRTRVWFSQTPSIAPPAAADAHQNLCRKPAGLHAQPERQHK